LDIAAASACDFGGQGIERSAPEPSEPFKPAIHFLQRCRLDRDEDAYSIDRCFGDMALEITLRMLEGLR
jgi:hypothetical protein